MKTQRHCHECGRPFLAGPHAKWGPCCRWKKRGRKPKKYVWTPEKDAFLRERYDSRVRRRAAEIARTLGWPAWVVKRRAAQLGLAAPRPKWQEWTAEELRFLDEHAGTRHVNWISRRLHRPLTSVVLKLKRLGISRRVRDGLTMRDLEVCLGLDHRRIERLVREGKLRAAREGTFHGESWSFREEDVLEFVRCHPMAFRLDRVDQLWFLDLVLGGRIGEAERRAPRRPSRKAAA